MGRNTLARYSNQFQQPRLSESVAIRSQEQALKAIPKVHNPNVGTLSDLPLPERIKAAQNLPLAEQLPNQTIELLLDAVGFLIATMALAHEKSHEIMKLAQRLNVAADACSDSFNARLTICRVIKMAKNNGAPNSPALQVISRVNTMGLLNSLSRRFTPR